MTWVLFLPSVAIAALSGSQDAVPAPASHQNPIVVIDAGHGGRNAGAPGVDEGVHEKAVTLAVAERLAGHLEAAGVTVILTRRADDYLTLRERTRIANQAGADVFISVHANSSGTGSVRGFETHVLSVEGNDVDAPALRSGEGRPRLGVDREVAAVVDAVEYGLAIDRAADLAADIQHELAAVRGADNDRGVKQNSHHVLLGATMPAVLVEIGFMDHPVEGRELTRPAVQDRIASAIARAILHKVRPQRRP